MAVNMKIVERFVREVISEDTLPYTSYIFDESTNHRYEVTVKQVLQKNVSIANESSVNTVLGPAGQKCSCCNGTGRA